MNDTKKAVSAATSDVKAKANAYVSAAADIGLDYTHFSKQAARIAAADAMTSSDMLAAAAHLVAASVLISTDDVEPNADT